MKSHFIRLTKITLAQQYMRTFFILVTLAAFFMGCHNVKQPADQPKKETPKALQDDKAM